MDRLRARAPLDTTLIPTPIPSDDSKHSEAPSYITDLSTWLILVPIILLVFSIIYALYKFGSPSPNVDDDEDITSTSRDQDQDHGKERTGMNRIYAGKKRKGRVTEEGNGSERTGLLGQLEEDDDEEMQEKGRGDYSISGQSGGAWGLGDEDEDEEDLDAGNLSRVSIATRSGQLPSSDSTLFGHSDSNPQRTPSKLSKHSYTQSSPQNQIQGFNSLHSSSSRHSSTNSLSGHRSNQLYSDPSAESAWRAINLSSTKRGAISSTLNHSSSRDSFSSINKSPTQERSSIKLAGTKAKSAAFVAPPVRNNSGSKKGETSKDQ